MGYVDLNPSVSAVRVTVDEAEGFKINSMEYMTDNTKYASGNKK